MLCVSPSAEAGAQSVDGSSNGGKCAQVNKKPSSYKHTSSHKHCTIETFAKKEETKQSPLGLHSLELHTQGWVCRLYYYY